jgi:peptidoglycan/LPS O-acetylase OafA/YrhL
MTPKLAAGLKSTHQTKTGNRILELDGLRAVAVMLVVIHHMLTISETLPAGPHQAYKKLFSYLGLLGVDVFFTISGFIITKLLLREWLRDSHVSLKAFYMRRAFRILPPFIAYLSVVATLASNGAILLKRSAFVVGALFLSNIKDHGCPE